VVAGAQARVQNLGRNLRRAAGLLHDLAEGLARDVHAGEQLVAGAGPRLDAAFKYRRIAVTQLLQARRRSNGEPAIASAAVHHHRPRPAPRHQVVDHQLETAEGCAAGKQKMAAGVRTLLADVQQGQLRPVAKHDLEALWIDLFHGPAI
jgi:hypothetical protein